MSNIIPITKATKKIKPPLRKSEIIEALAIRERENLLTANAEIEKQLKAAKTAFYSEANAELVRAKGRIQKQYNGQCFDVNSRDDSAYSMDVKVEMPITAELAKAYRKIRELEKKYINPYKIPSLFEIKRQIKDRIDGQLSGSTERVAALLADPATQRALDSTLEQLKRPAQLQIAG